MNVLRKLLALAFVLAAILCEAVWAAWFNPQFGDLYAHLLPLRAEDFPGDPMVGPLGVGLGLFLLAFVIWPAPSRESKD